MERPTSPMRHGELDEFTNRITGDVIEAAFSIHRAYG